MTNKPEHDIIITERGKQNTKEKEKKMYEVYFFNWDGCDEEPEMVFENLEEAREYVEKEDENLSSEEYYIIMKDGKEIY